MQPVFFFNDTATAEIYTLSLHDALPIYVAEHHGLHRYRGAPVLGDGVELAVGDGAGRHPRGEHRADGAPQLLLQDRKSTRLNSSHANISYAVFCLKKKTLHYHGLSVSVS